MATITQEKQLESISEVSIVTPTDDESVDPFLEMAFEYYCFDHDSEKLYGWRLEGLRYKEIPTDNNGFMESKILGYKLGVWKGKYKELAELKKRL